MNDWLACKKHPIFFTHSWNDTHVRGFRLNASKDLVHVSIFVARMAYMPDWMIPHWSKTPCDIDVVPRSIYRLSYLSTLSDLETNLSYAWFKWDESPSSFMEMILFSNLCAIYISNSRWALKPSKISSMNHCGFYFMHLFMFQSPLITDGVIYSQASVVTYAVLVIIIFDTSTATFLLRNSSV